MSEQATVLTWEIINPSDHYTIEAEDFEAAAIATLLLGEGSYGLRPEHDDGDELPVFLFGGFEEWWAERYPGGEEFGDRIEARRVDIADVLDSVTIGSRKEWEQAKAHGVPREEYHDVRRSSLNDIGARAWRMAERLRTPTDSENEPDDTEGE